MAVPQRVNPETLKSWLASSDPPTVVDVRDDDWIGGHIRGSIHVPSAEFINKLPKLRKETESSTKVVFYCQYSQQRGPSCATHYMRDHSKNIANKPGSIEQAVYVLDGGFSNWAYSFHGKDAFTESFAEDLYS